MSQFQAAEKAANRIIKDIDGQFAALSKKAEGLEQQLTDISRRVTAISQQLRDIETAAATVKDKVAHN
jgi:prefoldin subunit 5